MLVLKASSILARGNPNLCYFKMTNYAEALESVDFFQDCETGGEILDTIDAVFVTAEDN